MSAAETLVLLVRHPETDANFERRYVGSTESAYTARGAAQAAELAARLGEWRPDRTYSSPRLRALDLACMLPAPAPPPVIVEDLAEIDFGCAEHMTAAEMRAAGLGVDYPGMAPREGTRLCGETWEHFRARVASAAEMLGAQPGRTLAITHGGVIRAMLSVWLELVPHTMYRFEISNGGFALVAFADGTPRLRAFGPESSSLPG